MDPLSDVIALLRPSTAISKPITGRGRWGVRYAAYNAPGFTIILKGECWISFGGQEPVKFQKGDFVLLPSTPAFTLSSHPNVECEPRDPIDTPVRHGEQEGDADFESLGGAFRIEQVNAPLLLSLLPCVIHIPASEGRTGKLNSIIELIMDECGSEEPGKEMILQRMLDVLLIEALRWQGIAHDDVRAGLLNGMQDPGLAPFSARCMQTYGPTGRSQVLRKSPGFLARVSPLVSARCSAAVQSSISPAGGWRWQKTR